MNLIWTSQRDKIDMEIKWTNPSWKRMRDLYNLYLDNVYLSNHPMYMTTDKGIELLPRSNAATQNKRGEWVPAIPEPYYGIRKMCECGKKFFTLKRYREHYAP